MFCASNGETPKNSWSKDAMPSMYPPSVFSSAILVRTTGSPRYSSQRIGGRGRVAERPLISSCQNASLLGAPGKRPAEPTIAMSWVAGELAASRRSTFGATRFCVSSALASAAMVGYW